MPNADMYVMLGSAAPKCAAGVAFTGTSYGYGVCGTNPGRRSMLAWYYSYGDEKENDLETALVRPQSHNIYAKSQQIFLILSNHFLPKRIPQRMAQYYTKITR